MSPPGADETHEGPTGARLLLESLVAAGVDTCFANPGTSEMHFVAALDEVPAMRTALTLFEGAATGAADGFGRMAERPAAALLHLGPGLGNGLANLHNARRARTPVVSVVGDHATYHARYDAPLQSDIAALAGTVSKWVRTSTRPDDLAGDARDAVQAALGAPGAVATLVVPADVSWSHVTTGHVMDTIDPPNRRAPLPPDAAMEEAAAALRSGEPAAIFLGGTALRREAVKTAVAIASTMSARLLVETFPARLQRGRGIPALERMIYLSELAVGQLQDLRHLIVVDAAPPVSFFAYPGVPSELWPPTCAVHTLASPAEDATGALAALADRLGAHTGVWVNSGTSPPGLEHLNGPLDPAKLANVVGALLPEDAIVVDEANTAGLYLSSATAGAPPHDWLCLTGGAIGQGIPVATGAAVAAPGRPVLCLEADGSAMYTLQALWTQARESLNVTTVILANRTYGILRMELARTGAGEGGPVAASLLDLDRPTLDFVALAQGMGVPATRATTAEDFANQLGRALAAPGPSLIEAVLPEGL